MGLLPRARSSGNGVRGIGTDPDPQSWTVPRGWSLRYFPVTSSTNDDAKQAARDGCPDRTVVFADDQLAGRGRLGRSWTAPPRSSLLFSVVLRRSLPSVLLTATCSVAVAEAIAATTGLHARIKWPNDVMVRDRKVCGILTEALGTGARPPTVVGIGLNVNLDPAATGLPTSATSLSTESGSHVSRQSVFSTLIGRLDAYVRLADDELAARIFDRWAALLWRRAQRIRVDEAGTVVEGVVVGLTPSGALQIRPADGRLREIAVGEIVLG
ncbi:MAG: biotin--[acetyl-CoA-carboxylase] ligase [Chloroflexi bacterium]|nr:biotin--[acetyl-CoA-carboxylase] ligase [Chloroflexota bacterium]